MSKAERLSPASRRRLSETLNAELLHTCEHGHERCALRPHAACADEAAELEHAAHQSPAPLTGTLEHRAPAPPPTRQQSLF